jgi:hypothetical protein
MVMQRGRSALPALAFVAMTWAGAAQASESSRDTAQDAAAAEWRQDIVPAARSLAASADPRRQLVAAHLLLSPLTPDAGPLAKAAVDEVRAEAQSIYAQARSGSSDFLVLWLAATDCPFGDALCDRDGAIDALLRLEPDNAAPWFLALDRALRRKDPAEADVALDRIAAARYYRQHLAVQVRTWIDAYEALGSMPGAWPSAMVQQDDAPMPLPDDPADRQAFHGLAGFFVGLFKGWGRFATLTEACGPEAVQDAARLARCRGAIRPLRDADSLVMANLANLLMFRLAGDAATRDEAERMHRQHLWRIERSGAFAPNPIGADGVFDGASARAILAAWGTHDSERDVSQSFLAANGVPIEPPDDWQPRTTLADRDASR